MARKQRLARTDGNVAQTKSHAATRGFLLSVEQNSSEVNEALRPQGPFAPNCHAEQRGDDITAYTVDTNLLSVRQRQSERQALSMQETAAVFGIQFHARQRLQQRINRCEQRCTLLLWCGFHGLERDRDESLGA